MATGSKPPLSQDFTIGWIAALKIERAAAEAMLDTKHDEPHDFEQHARDTNAYTWGRMGEHDIVIASLAAGDYGTTPAATTASNLLASLPHIRIGLLVGIGGGIARPGRDIRLGDIVISEPDGHTGGVWQYDLVKAGPGSLERKGFLARPPDILLHSLQALQSKHEQDESIIPELLQDMLKRKPKMATTKTNPGYIYQGAEQDLLFDSMYEHVEKHVDCGNCCDKDKVVPRDIRESTDPVIHYGVIASGNTLVKDAATRDKIAEDAGQGCICFEMEAAGLMNHFPCLVIRGICDYADSHKNDQWQRYAAATAAAYAKEFLGSVRRKSLSKTSTALSYLENS